MNQVTHFLYFYRNEMWAAYYRNEMWAAYILHEPGNTFPLFLQERKLRIFIHYTYCITVRTSYQLRRGIRKRETKPRHIFPTAPILTLFILLSLSLKVWRKAGYEVSGLRLKWTTETIGIFDDNIKLRLIQTKRAIISQYCRWFHSYSRAGGNTHSTTMPPADLGHPW